MEGVHYYHIYADGKWNLPIDEHTQALRASGLIDQLPPVRVGIVGKQPNREAVKKHLAFPFEVVAEANTGWEQVTLDHIDLTGEDRILYCHTKGAANAFPFNHDWRRSMTKAVVYQWEKAVKLLDEYDAVGAHWKPEYKGHYPRHFSGNFWWANSEYLRTLPRPCPKGSRYDAEMWIGMTRRKGKVFDMSAGHPHPDNWMHFRNPTPPGYVKFRCVADTLCFGKGGTYVRKLTPELEKALDIGVGLERLPHENERFYLLD